MKLPLLAGLGLLAFSVGALVLSVSGHGGRSVQHLVTVPGVAAAGSSGLLGASAPKGDSPFAVYVPPAGAPPPAPAAAPQPAPPAAAPAPQPEPPGRHHHH